MNETILEGCAPFPLASYLKALGLIRLVAEQVDAGARGSWNRERFCLTSRLGSTRPSIAFGWGIGWRDQENAGDDSAL